MKHITTFQYYLDQMKCCLDNDLVLPALIMAVTIPDILGGATSTDHTGNNDRMRKWLNDNLEKTYIPSANQIDLLLDKDSAELHPSAFIDAKLLINLRNYLLHSGNQTPKNVVAWSKSKKRIDLAIDIDVVQLSSSMGKSTSSDGVTEHHVYISARTIIEILESTARKFYKENKGKIDQKIRYSIYDDK